MCLSFPSQIREALEKHPSQPRLELIDWYPRMPNGPHDDLDEIALACCPCFDTIAIKIVGRDTEGIVKAALSCIIRAASNLRHIRFKEYPVHKYMRRVGELSPWRIDTILHHPAQLERLQMFEAEKPLVKHPKELKFAGQMTAYTLDSWWATFIDFSHLVVLDFTGGQLDGPLLRRLATKGIVLNLRYFSSLAPKRGSEINTELESAFVAFINSCRLTGSAVSGGSIPDSLYLESQTPTLRFLRLLAFQLRIYSHGGDEQSYPAMSDARGDVGSAYGFKATQYQEYLGYIRETCPKLDSLEIDMKQATAHESKALVYTSLASFAQLSSVTLRFGISEDLRQQAQTSQTAFLRARELLVQSVWDSISSVKVGKALKKSAIEVHCQMMRPKDSFLQTESREGGIWTMYSLNERGKFDSTPRRSHFTSYSNKAYEATFPEY